MPAIRQLQVLIGATRYLDGPLEMRDAETGSKQFADGKVQLGPDNLVANHWGRQRRQRGRGCIVQQFVF